MRAYSITLITIFVFGCTSQKEKWFLKNILNDGARNSYYILTKVDDGKNKRICIINNYDLFGYLYLKGMPEEQYESKAFKILTEDKNLGLDTMQSNSYIFKFLNEQKLRDSVW